MTDGPWVPQQHWLSNIMKKKIITFLQKLAEVIFLDSNKAAKSALELSYRRLVAQVLEVTPDNLISYGASVYSQNEEDGIITEIMSRLDITHPTFIEFGVHVSENNTRCMLMNGGKGVWVDAGLSEFVT